ncbi:MAG: hypothetical protein ACO3A2_10360 [Bdellovibrionia bacterium]
MNTLIPPPHLPRGCESRCTGCQHHALDSSASLNTKNAWISKVLAPWKEVMEPVQPAPLGRQWGYRQKTLLHAHWNHQGHWDFGLLAKRLIPDQTKGTRKKLREFEVIPIHECPIHSERISQALQFFSKNLPPADEFPLRFISFSGSLLTWVLKANKIPNQLPELNATAFRDFGIRGIWINLNPCAGERVTWSKGWRHIWGQKWGEHHGLKHGPSSFQQLIPELHQDSLRRTAQFFSDSPETLFHIGLTALPSEEPQRREIHRTNPTPCSETGHLTPSFLSCMGSSPPESFDAIVDLYSGLGRSIQVWESITPHLCAVELSGEAVGFLRENTSCSHVFQGKTQERLPQVSSWLASTPHRHTFIYANPPRLGFDPMTLDWIIQNPRVKKVAYLSCSPGTLKRDLTVLVQNGQFQVTRIIPYDFFPKTHHFETLALLERKSL